MVAFLNHVNVLGLNICSSHIYKLYHCPSAYPLQQYSSMLSPSSLSLSWLSAFGLLFETQIFLFIIIHFAVWNTGKYGTWLRHKTNAKPLPSAPQQPKASSLHQMSF